MVYWKIMHNDGVYSYVSTATDDESAARVKAMYARWGSAFIPGLVPGWSGGGLHVVERSDKDLTPVKPSKEEVRGYALPVTKGRLNAAQWR